MGKKKKSKEIDYDAAEIEIIGEDYPIDHPLHGLSKQGAPYNGEIYPKIAYQACLHGARNQELADLFRVGIAAIERWNMNYPEFKAALVYGKDEFDATKVERALLTRALGQEVEEIEITDGLRGRSVKTKTRVVLPDTLALIFWLKNRQPYRWKDVKKVTTDGAVIQDNHMHPLKQLSTDGQQGISDNIDLDKLTVQEMEAFQDLLRKASGQKAIAAPKTDPSLSIDAEFEETN